MSDTGRFSVTFSEADKALIREIARTVISEFVENQLPYIVKQLHSDNSCSAKDFFNNEEKVASMRNAIFKVDELIAEKAQARRNKIAFVKWFIGGGVGLYGIKEIIGYFINKHH